MKASQLPDGDEQTFPGGGWQLHPSYLAISVSCEPSDDAPSRVRSHVLALRSLLGADLTDDLLLVASELATNAVRHAATRFLFRMRLTQEGVLVLVDDMQPLQAPQIPTVWDPFRRGGRGLQLVESLSSECGYTHESQRSKTVWALVPWERTAGQKPS